MKGDKKCEESSELQTSTHFLSPLVSSLRAARFAGKSKKLGFTSFFARRH